MNATAPRLVSSRIATLLFIGAAATFAACGGHPNGSEGGSDTGNDAGDAVMLADGDAAFDALDGDVSTDHLALDGADGTPTDGPNADGSDGQTPCSTTMDNCPANQHCDDSTHMCMAGCHLDQGCAGTSGDGGTDGGTTTPFCDTATHTCVQCNSDNECPLGMLCAGNVCATGCSSAHGCATGHACCNGACVDTQSNIANCGGCGVTCTTTNGMPACTTGACSVGSCTAPYRDCDSMSSNGCETNTANDVNNCGACGTTCATRANSTPTCSMGACGIHCNAGFADCNGDAADGCEVDTRTSTSNCGGCGMACSYANASATCSAGTCALGACNSGYGNCDNNAANGCEVNLQTTVTSCGACTTSCSFANASATCSNGSCAIGTCNLGYADCDGDSTNGCEVNINTSAANCGGCGMTCSFAHGNAVCSMGTCGLAGCATGFANCDGNATNGCETDLNSSATNCGACGTACNFPNASAGCNGGTCVLGLCNTGYGNCDSIASNGCETNVTNDPGHCGTCTTTCSGGSNAVATCTNSSCGLTCNAGYADCDGLSTTGCEASLSSANSCGACTTRCTNPTPLCSVSGGTASCVSGCGAGQTLCSGTCTDVQTDVSNCGTCGTTCRGAQNASGTCVAGICGIACAAGFADCDSNPGNGCETNLNSPTTCGSCVNACILPNATPGCSAGACTIAACNPGYGNCDGTVSNGCETNTTNSVSNCGACGTACPTPANAAPTCTSGMCSFSCLAGYADCDGSPTNGCETNLHTSTSNCGTCGTACTYANATGVCMNGACALSMCNAGFADCNSNPTDGCEVNIQTSVSHCGSCTAMCSFPNASATCAAGSCALGACSTGFGNCDSNPANGCETNVETSLANCGGCGTVCSYANASATCTNGACALGACNTGFGDCDSNAANGCETNLSTSLSSCGLCGRTCSFANASAACSNGTCSLGACNPGYANCDGDPSNGCEVNLQSSAGNCGACGATCAPANAIGACTNGACGIGMCNSGYGNCDGTAANGCETNLTTDPTHCGQCVTQCGGATNATPACTNGVCGITCLSGYANCDGNTGNGCEASLTSASSCGSCTVMCTGSTPICSASSGTAMCTSGCGTGQVLCNGTCTTLSSDANNCGLCGHVCQGAANAVGVCTNSVCSIQCTSGWADCNGNTADGCETNITTTTNCGVCNHVCNLPNATPVCTGGTCAIAACNAGYNDCDNIASDGCETNTATSTSNCGACGNACPAEQNATDSCTNGMCGFTCQSPYGNCDGASANGCETNLSTSVSNCGTCGAACSYTNASAVCTNGLCSLGMCNSGYGNCDGFAGNGCETSLSTNVMDCGGCGQVCSLPNAIPACSGGACVITACSSGYADCDGAAANGCETALNTPMACGGCGIVCPSPPNAVAACDTTGTCGYTCMPGYADCDLVASNGCEVNLATSTTSCGTCSNTCNSTNGTPVCTNGSCSITCSAGFANCDNNLSNGCETSVSGDPQACGTCTAVCPTGDTCNSGTCGCPSGDVICNGACANLLTDRNHCGNCANACAFGTACYNGLCTSACPSPFVFCSDFGNAVCTNTQTDRQNCGACNNTCPTNFTCVNSTCVPCNSPNTYCSGTCTSTSTDSNNCGVCGNVCPSGATCASGICSCPSGEVVCTNYCTNEQTDANNCGACGHACTAAQNESATCTNGTCGVACLTGYADCNNSQVDGCETNLQSSTSSCGTCGHACAAGQNCSSGTCVTPPPGDTCAGALTISTATNSTSVTFTNVGAVKDFTGSSCVSSAGSDIFFQFTLSAPAIVYADTVGSSFNTVLQFATSCTTPATANGAGQFSCNDDLSSSGCTTGGFQSRVVMSFPAAGTYYIVLSGYSAAQGTGTLHFSWLPIGSGTLTNLSSGSLSYGGAIPGSGSRLNSTCVSTPSGENSYWFAACPENTGGTLSYSWISCPGGQGNAYMTSAATGAIACNPAACGGSAGAVPSGTGLYTVTADGLTSLISGASYTIQIQRP